jgi:hypothetical protein
VIDRKGKNFTFRVVPEIVAFTTILAYWRCNDVRVVFADKSENQLLLRWKNNRDDDNVIRKLSLPMLLKVKPPKFAPFCNIYLLIAISFWFTERYPIKMDDGTWKSFSEMGEKFFYPPSDFPT